MLHLPSSDVLGDCESDRIILYDPRPDFFSALSSISSSPSLKVEGFYFGGHLLQTTFVCLSKSELNKTFVKEKELGI